MDTGTSTGRLMLAVLGGLADVERVPAQPKVGAVSRHVDSTWVVLLPSPRSNRRRLGSGAPRGDVEGASARL
jgi:hypothetical protein